MTYVLPLALHGLLSCVPLGFNRTEERGEGGQEVRRELGSFGGNCGKLIELNGEYQSPNWLWQWAWPSFPPGFSLSQCPSACLPTLSVRLWHCGTAAPANKLLATHLQLDMFCMSVSSAAARRQHDDDDDDYDDGTRVVPPLLLLLLSVVTAATRPALKADMATRPHAHPPSRSQRCQQSFNMHGKTISVWAGGTDWSAGKGEQRKGNKGGAGVTAGDSYCLPMSVSAENLPAINMLKAGEEPEQAEREREMGRKQEKEREERRGEKRKQE